MGPFSSVMKDVAETPSAWFSCVLVEMDGGGQGRGDALSLIK